MLDSFIGSNIIKTNLKLALAENKISSSILICAEQGLGCGYFARALASEYLYPNGGKLAQNICDGTDAEVVTIQGEGASGQIKISQITAARTEIMNTSIVNDRRVVIIKQAHMLNKSSANALLKILEEPPVGVLFILCAPNASTVMVTIRSRCNIYNLTSPTADECKTYLRAFSKDTQNIEALSQVYFGKIGTCKKYLQDKKKLKLFETSLNVATSIAEKDGYTLMSLLSKHEKEKDVTVSILTNCYHILAGKITNNSLGLDATEYAYISKMVSEVQNTLFWIAQNVNLKLCVCELATKI